VAALQFPVRLADLGERVDPGDRLTPGEDQRLLLFTAPPGTPSVDYLELLRVVGHETFTTP
jgi:hypothetical protein